MSQTATFSFFRFRGAARLWALTMMGVTPFRLRRVPGLTFFKLCGSGRGEGFTPTILPTVFAIMGTWQSRDAAEDQLASGQVFEAYRRHAVEDWHVFLRPTSARGAWAGQNPFSPEAATTDGPLAALTRATIRPRRLLRFWRRVPDISARVGQDPNVLFKIGIGEVPLLHQATFSIWPDATTMAGFARTGYHQEAIEAVRAHGWFREELYARFAVTGERGTWNGASPFLGKDSP